MRVIIIIAIVCIASCHLREESEKLQFVDDKYELNNSIEGCWLSAYGRGVGKPIRTCNDPEEQSGLLCYPKCKENFTGVGPVCWENCPSAFRDDGAFCFKPDSYGRGIGFTSQSSCESDNQSCESWGLLYYPKCKSSFHNSACCVCSPDCPSGMTDIGVSCQKNSYGRGVGTPLECQAGEQYDTGLCYPTCKDNFKSVGPVCWGSCPKDYTPCGALCLKNQSCANQIQQYFNGVQDIVNDFALKNYTKGLIDIAKFAEGFIFDVCK